MSKQQFVSKTLQMHVYQIFECEHDNTGLRKLKI